MYLNLCLFGGGSFFCCFCGSGFGSGGFLSRLFLCLGLVCLFLSLHRLSSRLDLLGGSDLSLGRLLRQYNQPV